MDMKSAKNAHYLQINNKVENILKVGGVEILPSFEAWERFAWIRKYFSKKPKEGYFIWVKKQIHFPLFTCVFILQKNTKQKLQNLLVVERELNIRLFGSCSAPKKNLCGEHKAKGKIILKEGSSLKYEHTHLWGKRDIVETDYNFVLEKNSELDYSYKNLFTPKKFKIKTKADLFHKASCNMKVVVDASHTEGEIKDILALKEKGASGQIQLRLIGRKNSKILAHSQILAATEGKGHLDCQGLLVDPAPEQVRCRAGKNSVIRLVPELVCRNKNAQITHEASIGKISEAELNYLKMRGLSEKEAINLIVNGFLGI